MELEVVNKEIGGVHYTMKYFPTMKALEILGKLDTHGFSPEVVFDVISNGATIGSVTLDRKRFDKQFQGKIKECMELFAECLKFNKLFPEAEEGNVDGSEE